MGFLRSKPRILLLLLFGLGILSLGGAGYLIWLDRQEATPIANFEALAPDEIPAGLRLTVLDQGPVRVTAAELRRASLADQPLALRRDGSQVPYLLHDGDIYFFAVGDENTLDAPPVYWLGPGEPKVMATRSAAGSGTGEGTGLIHFRWEENALFVAFAESRDAWFGRRLFAPGPLAETTIPIDAVAADGGEGHLRLRIWSNNADAVNPDHHVQAILNGVTVLAETWDGKQLATLDAPIPANVLREEGNTLQLWAPGDTGAAGDDLYVDWLEVDYHASLRLGETPLTFSSDAASVTIDEVPADGVVWDVTDPLNPVHLIAFTQSNEKIWFQGAGENRRYAVWTPGQAIRPTLSVAPTRPSLRAPERGADYIAIVPDDAAFADGVQSLLDLRTDQGMAVVSVSASHIYDEFGDGRPSPRAIKQFLAYAIAHWHPRPRFVLLVGDASYDTHDFGDGRNRNLIPTYHVYTQYAGYVASDTWLTMGSDSNEPQMAIGRLPAQTAQQLAAMVDKILAYEGGGALAWQTRALLVADDEPQFDAVISDLASDLGRAGFATDQLKMTENEEIRPDILQAINSGVGLINYVGHGSVQVWGDERVFQVSDTADLRNKDRYPIFVTFTCLNGYFNHPDVDALAESLLTVPDGGIVAAIAPSGRSLTSQQSPIAEQFYALLLNGDSLTVGEALLGAKQTTAGDGYLVDVIHTFNLLGDPALTFRRPE